MKRIKRKSNPDYEYSYFIFRPVFTIGGDEDIEVLSGATIDKENVWTFARDFERAWSEHTFESVQEALKFLRRMQRRKVRDYKSSSRKEEYIVSPEIVTPLYLRDDKYNGQEVYEVLGGEEVDGEEYSDYVKFVAYIGYHKIEV
jgi:hypothetical protein